METDGRIFTFESTGRWFEADRSERISISDDNELFYGYDGSIYIDEDGESDFELTPEEKKELAIYMINKWAAFGDITPFIAD